MSVAEALLAFTLAAGLLTLTPGLDTALVLRTAAADGAKAASLAALGVIGGCLAWGAAVALGLGALLAAAPIAFTALRWIGAGYLVWLGLGLLLKPRRSFEPASANQGPRRAAAYPTAWLRRGLLTNLLNPKVGVFYVSFLPQFLPAASAWSGPPGVFIFLLAGIHAALGLAWFAILIRATRPIAGFLGRRGVVSWLDRVTGGVFLGFGLRLALDRR